MPNIILHTQIPWTLDRRNNNNKKKIEKRQSNLIVIALQEDNNDETRFMDFANKFHVFSNVLEDEDIVSSERLGKPTSSSKPRPLRIKFQSQTKRKMILSMHHHRNLNIEASHKEVEESKRIFVRPDLTPTQLAEDKRLRE